MNSRDEKLAKLNEIGESAAAEKEAVAFLQSALNDADYIVRAKAFLLAERCYRPLFLTILFDILAKEEREWQLRALNVLRLNADESVLPQLKPLLFQREKPLLLRGAYLTVATIGGENALTMIAAFLRSPYCFYLKDAYLGAVLFFAVNQRIDAETIWSRVTADDEELSSFSDALLKSAEENSLLTVYPYPDYLSEMAKDHGIDAKTWKKAMYFPRKKNASEKKQKKATE
jgi:hypothetical protein